MAVRPLPTEPDGQMIEGRHSYESIERKISEIVLSQKPPLAWFVVMGVAFVLVNVLLISIGNLLLNGIGIWGNNVPVGWGFDIINFVWWIGIGHAGTLISAILLLMRQQWRTSINRFAEAMTLFAVVDVAEDDRIRRARLGAGRDHLAVA